MSDDDRKVLYDTIHKAIDKATLLSGYTAVLLGSMHRIGAVPSVTETKALIACGASGVMARHDPKKVNDGDHLPDSYHRHLSLSREWA
jgi:hypothetical protein